MNWEQLLKFFAYPLVGFVLGLLIRKYIIPILSLFAGKTKWALDDIIIKKLSIWILPWMVVLGAILGVPHLKELIAVPENINIWLKVFYLATFTLVLAKVASKLAEVKGNERTSKIPSSSIISSIISLVVITIGILIILDVLGISITPILTALGVGGVAVALALNDTLTNLFAGIQIISSRRYNVGDYIKLNTGDEGIIVDISWRITSIRNLYGQTIIVPNRDLASMIISNYTDIHAPLFFNIEFGVSYDSDMNTVEKLTLEVINECMKKFNIGNQSVRSIIRFTEFGDSSIGVKAIVPVNSILESYKLKSELFRHLKYRFDKEHINIPFPIRTVHLHNKN